jgi:hypothetical protein
MVFTLHAVLLLVLAGAICVIGDEQQYAKAFFLETFSPGWEQRWQYTNVKKYKGRFNNIKQEALQDEAIQVGLSWLVLSIATIEFASFFCQIHWNQESFVCCSPHGHAACRLQLLMCTTALQHCLMRPCIPGMAWSCSMKCAFLRGTPAGVPTSSCCQHRCQGRP